MGAQADRALADPDLASLVGRALAQVAASPRTADDLSVAGMVLGVAERARGLLVARS